MEWVSWNLDVQVVVAAADALLPSAGPFAFELRERRQYEEELIARAARGTDHDALALW